MHKKIINELRDKNLRHFACDNIPITKERLKDVQDELEKKFEDVLDCLLIDWRRDPNSQGTPKRLAKMYLNEIFVGRYAKAPVVTAFPNEGENAYTGMLVVKTEVRSLCAHHHQPVKGICYIGIIPNGKVIGLSKYSRLVDWVSRRGHLQEELTNMIAKEIMKATGSEDVGVYMLLSHGCCENRGIKTHDSRTQTTVLNGRFLTNTETKMEYFDNIKIQENATR